MALDFDGTVTELDVVDALLVAYAQGREWIEAEKAWSRGEISSASCLERQLGGVKISPKELAEFLKTVPLDPGFLALQKYLKRSRVPLIVLSDGFDLLIRNFFDLHGVRGVAFRSNALTHAASRLVPTFPHLAKSCGRCAHCKRSSIAEIRSRVRRVIFVGDGLSDTCGAAAAHVVFAKGTLARFCEDKNIPYRPYRNLIDVLEALPGLLKRKPAAARKNEKLLRSR